MASFVFNAFADLNNKLCDTGSRGWLTVPLVPVYLGALNLVVWLLIIVTAFVTWHYNNTEPLGLAFLKSILGWYLVLLFFTLIYKLFFCRFTAPASKKYATYTDLKAFV